MLRLRRSEAELEAVNGLQTRWINFRQGRRYPKPLCAHTNFRADNGDSRNEIRSPAHAGGYLPYRLRTVWHGASVLDLKYQNGESSRCWHTQLGSSGHHEDKPVSTDHARDRHPSSCYLKGTLYCAARCITFTIRPTIRGLQKHVFLRVRLALPQELERKASSLCFVVQMDWIAFLPPPTSSFLKRTHIPYERNQNSTCLIRMHTKLPGGSVTSPKGFKAASLTAGFKPSGEPDLALIVTNDNEPVTAAAMFTKNLVRAAPVTLSEKHMNTSKGKIAAVLLNSGQANAATGEQGMQDATESATALAEELACARDNVFLCSTGVIGHRIDMQKMKLAIPKIVAGVQPGEQAGRDAAAAIMTTDLRKKHVALNDNIGGKTVTVGGMSKGSGMIHPNMATMLAVLTCDADVSTGVWKQMLQRAVDTSFNAITVDGDTSTNDVVVALANGASGATIKDGSPEAEQLQNLLTEACVDLAKRIARDGEGATVLLEVRVSGANSETDARDIARTIASSSLTKAAVFGKDPNWGRIAGAAGRANAVIDPEKLRIAIGSHVLMEDGTPRDFDAEAARTYLTEKSKAMEKDYLSEHDTVVLDVCVGRGAGLGTAWGCDLSYDYVSINAEYTT